MTSPALPLLYSLSDVARSLGVTTVTVRARARLYGVGVRTVGGSPIFTEEDLEQLRTPSGPRGNPNWVKRDTIPPQDSTK